MRITTRRALLALSLCLGLASTSAVHAQSNTIPGLDVQLAFMDDVSARGRTGTYPTGVNGVAIETTICNRGSVEVDWFAPMDPRHPMIAFLIARESDGRLEQISDRSYLKHGFFALTSSQCTSCSPPGGPSGSRLGLGCSDTYSVFNNGDNYWLGPPEEIDPWLGTWDPICSWFDMGTMPTGGAADCDGQRSLTYPQSNALGPVGNRINVLDEDLDVPGANFFYQGYYVVLGEAEADRQNNLATQRMNASWTGSQWNLSDVGQLRNDTILSQWSGATVTSATNGADDGRVYVAVNVTGPVDGLYHYEYAVHNRDNFQGLDGFRIPVCDGAQVLNFGFHDVDQDGTNEWSASVSGGEIAFTTAGDNPLQWNTFFNFWFDSDAATTAGMASLDQFQLVAGAPSFDVDTTIPGALYNANIGEGCALGTAPALFSNDRATIGNAGFTLETTGNVPGQANALLLSAVEGSLPLAGGCTLWLGGTLGVEIAINGLGVADGTGRVVYSAPVPADISLEGLRMSAQTVGVNPGGGAAYNVIELSNGLLVRVGDTISECP